MLRGQRIRLVYRVKLEPRRLTFQVKDEDIPLALRIGVTAEIKTGERRVIEFLISPFLIYVDELLRFGLSDVQLNFLRASSIRFNPSLISSIDVA